NKVINIPKKNGGIAMAIWLTNVRIRSNQPFTFLVAINPKGIDSIIIIITERRVNHKVIDILPSIKVLTGVLYWLEVPKSPLKTFDNHLKYRIKAFSFNPISSLMISMAS